MSVLYPSVATSSPDFFRQMEGIYPGDLSVSPVSTASNISSILSNNKYILPPQVLSEKQLPYEESDIDQQKRFTVELEFIQMLSNPFYLECLFYYLIFIGLSGQNYFEQKSFVNYLEYLLYWKRPEYARFISYPNCLPILDLLQNEQFRKQLKDPRFIKFLEKKQLDFKPSFI